MSFIVQCAFFREISTESSIKYLLLILLFLYEVRREKYHHGSHEVECGARRCHQHERAGGNQIRLETRRRMGLPIRYVSLYFIQG